MTDSTYETTPLIKVTSPSQHVLLVELQRKPVNAFHEPFWTELGQLFDKISKDGAVRAVVLASAFPKMFTAGLDLTDAGILQDSERIEPARKAFLLRDHILKIQSAISSIESCRHPVILAAHGVVFGIGVDIACACDIRFAASDSEEAARFSIKEVDVGLAADVGTLARLPKISGNISHVTELALTARPFGAAEARELGLVSKVVKGGRKEVVEAALETARMISEKSPIAIVGTKQFLKHARDHTVEDTLEYEATWNAFALQTMDMRDAFAAFKSKKPTKFGNLPKL
ncbi:hypothetical protein ACEPAG_1340 [Sanghuangporus baumii]